jgi:hypothetical protein
MARVGLFARACRPSSKPLGRYFRVSTTFPWPSTFRTIHPCCEPLSLRLRTTTLGTFARAASHFASVAALLPFAPSRAILQSCLVIALVDHYKTECVASSPALLWLATLRVWPQGRLTACAATREVDLSNQTCSS